MTPHARTISHADPWMRRRLMADLRCGRAPHCGDVGVNHAQPWQLDLMRGFVVSLDLAQRDFAAASSDTLDGGAGREGRHVG
jgi:hypothetical protein